MKKIIAENYKQLILLLIFVLAVSIQLPYYVEAPGGTINLTKKIDKNYDKKNGSLNMLYVTEYKGNIITVLLSQIFPNWDLNKIEEQQISDETSKEIYTRNKAMLDNSIGSAMYVAYKEAGKGIKIKDYENIVIAVTKDNGFKIGDIILKVDDTKVEDIETIRNYLKTLNIGDTVNIKIKRNNKEKNIKIKVEEDKLIGIMLITNYTYETDEELDIAFRNSEGGSSGGLILALGIYNKITGDDILKGRNIAGTGTIDNDGNIGEIDGIKYKIAGAVKDKMDIVLVSPDNYEEAKKIIKDNNYKIELVKVSTFKEALDYLKKYLLFIFY